MSAEHQDLLDALATVRRAVVRAVRGLDEEQARRVVLPSGWYPLGLVQHLTMNERYWLRWAVGGETIPGTSFVDGRLQVVLEDKDDDDEWAVPPHLDGATVLARYEAEAALADRAVAACDLDGPPRQFDPVWREWYGEGASALTARQFVLHLIGETGQHAGHAQVVRELLDADAREATPPR